MKGDQKMPPPGSVVKTHEWKPKQSHDKKNDALRRVPHFNTKKGKK